MLKAAGCDLQDELSPPQVACAQCVPLLALVKSHPGWQPQVQNEGNILLNISVLT